MKPTLPLLFLATAFTSLPAIAAAFTVINHSDKPVHSAVLPLPAAEVYGALKLPTGTPLRAAAGGTGREVALVPGRAAGAETLGAVVSLAAGERMELHFEKAAMWPELAVARFDAASGSAKLGNGVVEFVLADGKWSLAFAGAQPGETLLRNCRPDLWLDGERRGRLMGIAAEKVREMGLVHSGSAKLVRGEARVEGDGTAVLQLVHGFADGVASVVWTEIFTLRPGSPMLGYRSVFETQGSAPHYVAYVGLGSGLVGEFGPLLHGKRRFKYQDPKTPARILLSGAENSHIRLGWRDERCWVGVDSELGCGVGLMTDRAVTRAVPGNCAWSFSNSGFIMRFLDPEQENQPYEFTKDRPLKLGFGFLATSGGVGIWGQAKKTFAALTQGQTAQLDSACAVYLDGRPLRAAEVVTFHESGGPQSQLVRTSAATRSAALIMDFQRACRLVASADGASTTTPVTLSARTGSASGPVFTMRLDAAGEKQADLTALTSWLGKRQAFTLEVEEPAGAALKTLRIEPASFPAPELELPADGVSLTDIATFFRWRQVSGALEYEIELSRDESFRQPVTLKVRSEAPWPYYMPADAELPKPGRWFWRVRALEPERPGEWSVVRRFDTSSDITRRPVTFTNSPAHPLFTIEACRVKDMGKFTHTLPDDLKPYVAINCEPEGYHDLLAYLKPLQSAGVTAFIRTHGPGPISHWNPLANVEHVFQTYPNVIGIMAGETLSTHYHGGAMQTYVNRLLKLCGKYGRLYYDADGTYPGENKWQELYAREGTPMRDYAGHLIFAQKNNILHRQFVSQSSVLGLYLTGGIFAQGAWEDGGWYWDQVGFRKLGEIRGQRGGVPTDMPRNFWNLNFLMGIARGCTVFSFEGQTGTIPVSAGWKITERGQPPQFNAPAHWTTEGELTPTFHRFLAPFMRGVIQHQLVPTKEQVLQNVKLAVFNDGIPKKENGDQYYYEWEALYRGTYGFRDVGIIPGSLMEFFPNTGRYHYFPVFPQGKAELGHSIATLPLSQLGDAAAVKQRFDQAYPEWYEGSALVTLVGDTLAVLNSHENQDISETYTVPLKSRAGFQTIAGKIQPHAYLMGKFENNNHRLWLQANAEYPERDTEITVTCTSPPNVTIIPAGAAKVNQWNPATRTLTLHLTHAGGAVEVTLTK